ncbi:MAG: hypothetical protein AAF211_03815 [Myxococcota bacterium]
MREVRKVPRAYLQLFSASDDGMNLELCMADEQGRRVADGPYPLLTFRAETEGMLSVVFEFPDGPVELPLSELERAIAAAKEDVHSESFYDGP